MPDTECADKPIPPAVDASDNEWAIYKKRRDQAGDECRDKLSGVHQTVTKWPK